MNKIGLSVVGFAIACLSLSGCNNAALEERVADLEGRISELENGSTSVPTQSASYAEADEPTPNSEAEPVADGPIATVAFAETTHEFGTIDEGDVVEHTFVFTNTGSTPLIIQDAKASCGCTVPKKPEQPVAPGETGEIQVRFNSQGKPGVQNKTVTVTANTQPATTRLFIKADVTPKSKPTAGPVKK